MFLLFRHVLSQSLPYAGIKYVFTPSVQKKVSFFYDADTKYASENDLKKEVCKKNVLVLFILSSYQETLISEYTDCMKSIKPISYYPGRKPFCRHSHKEKSSSLNVFMFNFVNYWEYQKCMGWFVSNKNSD